MPALRRRLESLSLLPVRPAVTALVKYSGCGISGVSRPCDGHYLWNMLLAAMSRAIQTLLSQLTIPDSDYFIWITGEGKTVKHLSQRFENGF
ncbi:siderophore-interacting protein [Salmonella enterica subsp. arizonae]|uniref:Siderophore-interacting protein n=1 Tax=Salmonella enterica subsp. arizonae TaxID=59203 RepID=A0A379RWY9_SALER|nr:siderophore-interacting protein [Salmonella enterica subsp. arizonae]